MRERHDSLRVGCMRFWRHADDVPLLGKSSGHPWSPARPPAGEETRCERDGPAKIRFVPEPREGRRLLPDQVPSTTATASPRGLLPDGYPWPASRSRRPHVPPKLGRGANRTLQALFTGETRGELRESGRLLRQREYRAWG